MNKNQEETPTTIKSPSIYGIERKEITGSTTKLQEYVTAPYGLQLVVSFKFQELANVTKRRSGK